MLFDTVTAGHFDADGVAVFAAVDQQGFFICVQGGDILHGEGGIQAGSNVDGVVAGSRHSHKTETVKIGAVNIFHCTGVLAGNEIHSDPGRLSFVSSENCSGSDAQAQSQSQQNASQFRKYFFHGVTSILHGLFVMEVLYMSSVAFSVTFCNFFMKNLSEKMISLKNKLRRKAPTRLILKICLFRPPSTERHIVNLVLKLLLIQMPPQLLRIVGVAYGRLLCDQVCPV